MIYRRIEPSPHLAAYIVCFWLVDSEGDYEPVRQKIIPDGFPELIFHYGDPYRINISGTWEVQGDQLIAGQLTHHFYLENTGVSGMIGVKLKPTALSRLFDLTMTKLTDTVGPITSHLPNLKVSNVSRDSFQEFIDFFEAQLTPLVSDRPDICTQAVELVIGRNGMIGVSELAKTLGVSERQMERRFKREVGLTPKFFSRIVRLSYIFKQVEQGDYSWAKLAYQAGFTDQSHFIKNFKEFTGEDPTKYRFDQQDMANFFLKP